VIRFFLKLGGFAAGVIIIQFGIFRFWPAVINADRPEEIAAARAAADRPDIVFLGDSTITKVPDGDPDPRTLPQLLQADLPGRKVIPLAHVAYQAEVFADLTGFLGRQPAKPKTLIIPINLRSFSPEWHRRPEYQFEKIRLWLRYGDNLLFQVFYKPLLVFKVFNLKPISPEEYALTPVWDGTQKIGLVKDSNDRDPKAAFTLRYMAAIPANHPKLLALATIANLARQNGIQTVFYLTPIDYQAGDQAVGKRFEDQNRQNAETITRTLAAAGAKVADLTFTLTTDNFEATAQNLAPNEHLFAAGRQTVADRLAQELQ
jgi:hypothetical protein